MIGVMNACLPVMKPIFSKLGDASIFSSLRARTPTARSGKPINTPRSNCNTHSSRGGKYPHIARQIVHKDSLRMVSTGLPSEDRAPSIPLPTFSWRPVSRYYLPKAEWEHDTSGLRKDIGIGVATDWDPSDAGHRASEGNSPTLPWKPHWQSRRKDAVDRC